MRKLFDKFSVFDYVIMALMAAVGVAVKPIVTAVAHIITGSLFIPAGTVAGGIYMLFLVLGAAIVGKRGASTMIAVVQALIMVVSGIFGTHGIISLLTYSAPGLAIDLIWLLMRHRGCCALCCFFAGMVANMTGSFGSNVIFFRLPWLPLLIMLAASALSGGLGGLIAWNINKVLIKYKLTGRGSLQDKGF